MANILLLDAEFVQSYSIAKALKRAGHKVIAASPKRFSYGFFSRFPDKKIKSPDSADNNIYLHFLINIIKKEDIDVLIPVTNNTAEILSRNYDLLAGLNVRIASMPWDKFIVAHNKEKFMDFCQNNNLPCPRTQPVTIDNMIDTARDVGYPLMIKPNISVGARGIVKIDNDTDLKDKLPGIIDEFGNCTLQQYIDNGDFYYNVMMYRTSEGKCITTIIEIQRYFPIKAGSSSFCVSIENPELESICREALEKLGWIGFADFDVLFDKKEGFKIIEINPRMPASVHAALISGINFPEITVDDLLGNKVKDYNYTPGMCLRFLLMDVMWYLSASKDMKKNVKWFNFFDRKTRYQDTSISDPFIILAGIGEGLSKILSSKYRKAKLTN